MKQILLLIPILLIGLVPQTIAEEQYTISDIVNILEDYEKRIAVLENKILEQTIIIEERETIEEIRIISNLEIIDQPQQRVSINDTFVISSNNGNQLIVYDDRYKPIKTVFGENGKFSFYIDIENGKYIGIIKNDIGKTKSFTFYVAEPVNDPITMSNTQFTNSLGIPSIVTAGKMIQISSTITNSGYEDENIVYVVNVIGDKSQSVFTSIPPQSAQNVSISYMPQSDYHVRVIIDVYDQDGNKLDSTRIIS